MKVLLLFEIFNKNIEINLKNIYNLKRASYKTSYNCMSVKKISKNPVLEKLGPEYYIEWFKHYFLNKSKETNTA